MNSLSTNAALRISEMVCVVPATSWNLLFNLPAVLLACFILVSILSIVCWSCFSSSADSVSDAIRKANLPSAICFSFLRFSTSILDFASVAEVPYLSKFTIFNLLASNSEDSFSSRLYCFSASPPASLWTIRRAVALYACVSVNEESAFITSAYVFLQTTEYSYASAVPFILVISFIRLCAAFLSLVFCSSSEYILFWIAIKPFWATFNWVSQCLRMVCASSGSFE